MLYLSERLLLLNSAQLQLTVVTNPTSATAVITVDGTNYTTKSMSIPRGKSVTVTVSYSNTTTKTYTFTITKDTTLTFTRTYTTTTSLNNEYTISGSTITVSSAGSATGFAGYNGIQLIGTETDTTSTSFDWTVQFKTGTAVSGTKDILGNSYHVETSSTAANYYGLNIQLYSGKLRLIKAGSSFLSCTTTLSTSTIYTARAYCNGTTYYLQYGAGTSSSNIESVSKASTAKPFNRAKILWVGNYARGSSSNVSTGSKPFNVGGIIYLESIKCYENSVLKWNGTITSYSYYFTVSQS